MEGMKGFAKNRGQRSLLAAAGLLVCALGTYFELQANIGMAPWEALNQGLAIKFSVSYGTACRAVAVLVIVADLLLRERIGIGTFFDALLVGTGVDFCTAAGFVPVQTTLFGQLGFLLLGIVTICFGIAIYMRAGLCCGPRDAFLVGVGKRFSKVPIGIVNIAILGTVLVGCLVLGSPIGLGTVISAFGTGVIMEAVFRLVHFEARNVVHESILETCTEMMHAMGTGVRHKRRAA